MWPQVHVPSLATCRWCFHQLNRSNRPHKSHWKIRGSLSVYRNPLLGCDNSNILEFSPRKLGKMNPFWRAYFSDGWFNHQPVFVALSRNWSYTGCGTRNRLVPSTKASWSFVGWKTLGIYIPNRKDSCQRGMTIPNKVQGVDRPRQLFSG